jgi:diphosphomevalonate decarboxylase
VEKFRSVANTMQGLVKYHGMRDWKLRIPYHDSISVNTTVLFSEAQVTIDVEKKKENRKGELLVEGKKNPDAERRLEAVARALSGKSFEELGLRISSRNRPHLDAKGLGFSSSAGAALTLACSHAVRGREKEKPDYVGLSRVARLFAASASRSLVGGYSRLHAGKNDEETYAEKIGDEGDLDLRMLIVPLPSTVHTEDAHREVMSSPFFKARLRSAAARCDQMESAIRGGDLRRMGELTEQDTLELHAITMTGSNRLIIMSPDTVRVAMRVRELRSEGLEAYFSMQTGPSVFINTSEKDEERVRRAISKMGYHSLRSGVGDGARILTSG